MALKVLPRLVLIPLNIGEDKLGKVGGQDHGNPAEGFLALDGPRNNNNRWLFYYAKSMNSAGSAAENSITLATKADDLDTHVCVEEGQTVVLSANKVANELLGKNRKLPNAPHGYHACVLLDRTKKEQDVEDLFVTHSVIKDGGVVNRINGSAIDKNEKFTWYVYNAGPKPIKVSANASISYSDGVPTLAFIGAPIIVNGYSAKVMRQYPNAPANTPAHSTGDKQYLYIDSFNSPNTDIRIAAGSGNSALDIVAR